VYLWSSIRTKDESNKWFTVITDTLNLVHKKQSWRRKGLGRILSINNT
jgi:hypothetical protein